MPLKGDSSYKNYAKRSTNEQFLHHFNGLRRSLHKHRAILIPVAISSNTPAGFACKLYDFHSKRLRYKDNDARMQKSCRFALKIRVRERLTRSKLKFDWNNENAVNKKTIYLYEWDRQKFTHRQVLTPDRLYTKCISYRSRTWVNSGNAFHLL